MIMLCHLCHGLTDLLSLSLYLLKYIYYYRGAADTGPTRNPAIRHNTGIPWHNLIDYRRRM